MADSDRKPINWIAIRTAYVVKGWTLGECAKEFGVDPTTVRKKAAKEKWTDERHKNATAGAAAVADAMRIATEEHIRTHAKRAEERQALGDRVQALLDNLITQAEARPTPALVRAVAESYEKLMAGHAKGVQVDRVVRALDDSTPSDVAGTDDDAKPGKTYEVVVEQIKESA